MSANHSTQPRGLPPAPKGVTFFQYEGLPDIHVGSDGSCWRWNGRWIECLRTPDGASAMKRKSVQVPPIIVPPNRQKLYFPYTRVSTTRQARSGLSLESQEAALRKDCETVPDALWAGLYKEPEVSASRPFAARPVGRVLNERLRAGDIVGIAISDRGFRSVMDFCGMLDQWEWRGVTLRLLDMPLDLSTPTGRASAQFRAVCAELEKNLIRERTQKALNQRRERGLPPNQEVPRGMKLIGRRRGPGLLDERYLVPDPEERAVIREIVRLRDEEGLSNRLIVDHIEIMLAEHEGRKVIYGPNGRVSAFHKKRYDYTFVRQAYRTGKQLLAEEAMEEATA